MDPIETVGAITGGGLVGGILTYLTLAAKLKKYIREESGRGEEINVSIPKQPIRFEHEPKYVLKADFEKYVTATDTKFTQIQTEAAKGRSNLHTHMEAVKDDLNSQITDIRRNMSDVPEKTINLLIKTKGLI